MLRAWYCFYSLVNKKDIRLLTCNNLYLSALCWVFCSPNCILSHWNKPVKSKNQMIIVQCKQPIKKASVCYWFFYSTGERNILQTVFLSFFLSFSIFYFPPKLYIATILIFFHDDCSWRNTTHGHFSVHAASGEFAAHKIACSWWQSG